MAYSFRKIFFVGQNLKHVHMTYSFLELLIFFWLTLDHHTKEILHVNTNFMRNQSWSKKIIFIYFWYRCWKNLFFNIKLKLLINFNFSQFHEHIFWSSRTLMLFKIGALKNFAILRIKKRLRHRKKQPLGGLLVKRCSFLEANVDSLIHFLLKMLG